MHSTIINHNARTCAHSSSSIRYSNNNYHSFRSSRRQYQIIGMLAVSYCSFALSSAFQHGKHNTYSMSRCRSRSRRQRLYVASSTTVWDATSASGYVKNNGQQHQTQQTHLQDYIEEMMQRKLLQQKQGAPNKSSVRNSGGVTSAKRLKSRTGVGEQVIDIDEAAKEKNISDLNVSWDETRNSKAIVQSLKLATLHVSKERQISRSSTMPGYRIKDSTESPSLNSNSSKKQSGAGQVLMYENSVNVPDSMIDFTEEIHAEARITPAEEVTLGSKTQELIRLETLYSDLEAELNRKPTDDEWCSAAGKINMTCLKQCIEEGKAAKDKLVVSNLRMVQRVVNLYIRNGLGSEYNAGDMMQEGTLALIRAAEKFEPTKGFRFSTYAMYWIRASVKRSQMLQSRIITIPQRVHETYKRVTKIETELRTQLGREPTKDEIAEAANIKIGQLEKVLNAMNLHMIALDKNLENSKKPSKGDKKTNLYEIIPDVDTTQYANDSTLREELINSLRRHLTPMEVKILCLRYGLLDSKVLPPGFGGPLTIREVGLLVGLKPDKVRRTINKSLRQLKYLIAHDWPEYSQEVLEELKEN